MPKKTVQWKARCRVCGATEYTPVRKTADGLVPDPVRPILAAQTPDGTVFLPKICPNCGQNEGFDLVEALGMSADISAPTGAVQPPAGDGTLPILPAAATAGTRPRRTSSMIRRVDAWAWACGAKEMAISGDIRAISGFPYGKAGQLNWASSFSPGRGGFCPS